MTRAAEELCITQPRISQQIQALERELGSRLLDRSSRGVAVTPAGALMADYARESLGLLDEGRTMLTQLEKGSVGRLTLGAGVTTCIFHLPPVLRAFRESHPGVELVIRSGGSSDVNKWVLARSVDFGLVTSAEFFSDLTVETLFHEEIVLVAPPEHPILQPNGPRELLPLAPLILFPKGSGFRAYLEHYLEDAGLPFRVVMETDSAEAIKQFVATGLGVSFLPAAAVQTEIDQGILARGNMAGFPPLERSTSLVYRRGRRRTAAAEALRRLLRDRLH